MNRELIPQDYADLFQTHPVGQLILADLVGRYGRNPFVAGGLEGDRQTCFNAGAASVLNYLLAQISRADEEAQINDY